VEQFLKSSGPSCDWFCSDGLYDSFW